MPILDVGYRSWTGHRTGDFFRWWVVAWTGIRLVLAGSGLRRVMVASLIPSILAGVAIGVYEQAATDPSFRASVVNAEFGRNIRRARGDSIWTMLQPALEQPEKNRNLVWKFILHWYFRYPQAICIVVLLGLVAPRLISYDLRSRGYLLYLSRPISPWGYVIGKANILFFLSVMITTLPAMIVYCVGIALSSSANSIIETWDIPLRILMSTLVLVLPTCAVALALSAVTEGSRFAGFGWFAIWVVGWVTYLVMTATIDGSPRSRENLDTFYYVSPYHLLGYTQREIFGLFPESHTPHLLPWILCSTVTIVGFAITYWRVSRTLKA